MVHRSPVRKFAKTSEGVGHRHKLTKLVEESNKLISASVANHHGSVRYVYISWNETVKCLLERILIGITKYVLEESYDNILIIVTF